MSDHQRFAVVTGASSGIGVAYAERLAARGLPVTSRTLPGIDHGFDQSERSALSPLDYDPAATATAIALADSFLDALP